MKVKNLVICSIILALTGWLTLAEINILRNRANDIIANDYTTPEIANYRKRLEDAGFNTSTISNLAMIHYHVTQNQMAGGDWDDFSRKFGQETTDLYQDRLNARKTWLRLWFESIWGQFFILIAIYILWVNKEKILLGSKRLKIIAKEEISYKLTASILILQSVLLSFIINENIFRSFGFAIGTFISTAIIIIPIAAITSFIPWFMILKIQEKRISFSKIWILVMTFICMVLFLGKNHLNSFLK